MARPTTKEKPRRGKPGMKGEVRRYSKLPREEIDKIDYKNVALLQRFITERGKIRSRRVTGLSRRDQSKMARAVKRAREVGLLPYVDVTKGLERTGGRGSGSGPAPWNVPCWSVTWAPRERASPFELKSQTS
jgi:small subunit ribosomal protein S18